ncbi:MAG: hypothetical protein RDU59_03290 [Thermodesulfobacteriota bacterium]|nr:hypothetical protein [Thermodesulfobacteriota bacterium]
MTVRKSFMLGSGLIIMSLFLFYPAKGRAEVDVSVNIGLPLPSVVISSPPAVVMIPGSPVYFDPDIEVDIFFHRGYWYRPYRERWYRATHYNGPWRHIARRAVPTAIVHVPPSYRHIPPGHERIPYGQLKKHWKEHEKASKKTHKSHKHGRHGD